MSSPAERARLLDPEHDPPRAWPIAGNWERRADARLAVLQEAVEVLAATSTAWPSRAISPELALMWATARWNRRYRATVAENVAETPEDYLAAMVADGLRVRGGGGG